ncbi:MAG TPA: hypothetical protein VJ729_00095 [Nitrososphaeraceae archaeon]|nr:hypothetical protein [Nitrososphaeraceae archaeon]
MSLFPNAKSFCAIIALAVIFGLLGFAYSFFGLLNKNQYIVSLEPFRLLTLNEIGGHFLFGVIVSIPLRNVKASILIGLMALTIDSDHLLNLTGFHIQARIDHSIPFAIVSSVLLGLVAGQVYYKISRENRIHTTPDQTRSKADSYYYDKVKKQYSVTDNTHKRNSFFIFFSLITFSAFLSHIAYDVFVDSKARFPLFAPFSFSEYIIANYYGIPIEATGFLVIVILVYLPHISIMEGKSRLSFGLSSRPL